MVDSTVNELKRQCAKDPDDKTSRIQLYQELIRCGQASPRSLALAAQHGDSTAQALFKGINQALCRTADDVAELAKLPVQQLDLQFCNWLSLDDLSPLKALPLQSLNLRGTKPFSFKFLENLNQAKLKVLRLPRMLIQAEQLKLLERWPLETLQLSEVELGSKISDWEQPSLKDLQLTLRFDADDALSLLQTLKLQSLRVYDPGLSTNAEFHWLSKMPLQSFTSSGFYFYQPKSFQGFQDMQLKELGFRSAHIDEDNFLSFNGANINKLSIDGLLGWEILKKTHSWPIQELFIERTPLCHETFEHLKRYPLKELTLSSCWNIQDRDIAVLSELPLETLNLQFRHIQGASLKHLRHSALKSLKISLRDCQASDLEDLNAIGLRHLSIDFQDAPSRDLLKALKGLPLEELSIHDAHLLKDKDLRPLQQLPLKRLRIRKAKQLTGRALEHFKDQALELIDLCHWPLLSDSGFQALAKLPLTRLRLLNCPGLTDTALTALEALPLRMLNASNCPGITQTELNGMTIHQS